ncbi:MAG TPA: hypothetical protein VHX52_09980 [Steroidobacteraceae bacterium]|nr:hypothetical protein [Steroidobacteraceae bacterium]
MRNTPVADEMLSSQHDTFARKRRTCRPGFIFASVVTGGRV